MLLGTQIKVLQGVYVHNRRSLSIYKGDILTVVLPEKYHPESLIPVEDSHGNAYFLKPEEKNINWKTIKETL